jgi:hypothetical protein
MKKLMSKIAMMAALTVCVATANAGTSYAAPARVTVTRDGGLFGASLAMVHSIVDGKPVAKFHCGDSFSFALNPGQHVLTTKQSPAIGLGTFQSTVMLDARSGATYAFRILHHSEVGFMLQPSAVGAGRP